MARFSRCLAALFVLVVVESSIAVALSLDECKKLASQGDSEAAYQLGVRYETGDGVRQDRLRAFANYRKAADGGHREACRKMADIYDAGKWVSKDKVLAAKYRAMSVGQSGDAAATSARERIERESVDEIEVALDYIIGRNGKVRDAKTGIRLLYSAAKDKPAAQRVFVQRWEAGDLDLGLETISVDEWDLILPWFKEQFDSGKHLMGGYLLGLAAYYDERYDEAVAYWKTAGRAGVAKAWYCLGRMYDPRVKPEIGGGPAYLHNVHDAVVAYEKCLALDPDNEDANYLLGLIRLFGKAPETDYRKALSIFSRLLKMRPGDKWYLYYYGLAGIYLEEDAFNKRWPNVKSLQARYKSGYYTARDEKTLDRALKDLENVKSRCAKYANCIRKAADKGCEDAKKFLEEYYK